MQCTVYAECMYTCSVCALYQCNVHAVFSAYRVRCTVFKALIGSRKALYGRVHQHLRVRRGSPACRLDEWLWQVFGRSVCVLSEQHADILCCRSRPGSILLGINTLPRARRSTYLLLGGLTYQPAFRAFGLLMGGQVLRAYSAAQQAF